MGGKVGQHPLPHGGEHQGHRQHQQQEGGIEQQPQVVDRRPHPAPDAVGPPDTPHEAVGRPDGEVDGEHQGEPEHGGAGGLSHVLQIRPAQLHRRPGHHRVNHPQNAVHIQLQEAQKGADKDENREQGEENVVGQGRALPGDVVGVVAPDHLPEKADGGAAKELRIKRKFFQAPHLPGSARQYLRHTMQCNI